MFATGAVLVYQSFFGNGTWARGPWDMALAIGSTCAFLLLAIPALVLWLVWVHGAHRDLGAITVGRYGVSPGQAVGFSFIPLFDAFWVVYMPWRLSVELNRQLGVRGLTPISSAAVMTCQIISIPAAFLLPGLTPMLYAVSMLVVQNGLNRLQPVSAEMRRLHANVTTLSMD
jgi:hypothetical protein